MRHISPRGVTTFGVILGAVVLHERPAPQQRAGIVATLAAVTLLAVSFA